MVEGDPLLKTSEIYPTMMKLGTVIPYLKKLRKLTLGVLLTSAFFTRNQRVLLSEDIQIYIPLRYIISTSSNFLESLRIVVISMVKFLIMSAKMLPQAFLKQTFFLKKRYSVIISAHDVTNTILSCDSNCNVNVVI